MAMTDEYPPYLDEMEVGDERSLSARIEALTAEIATLNHALDDARRGKRILLIEGDDLTNEVVRFLHEDLGLDVTRKARPADGEELWLADPEGRPWACVHVVSFDEANVGKYDVAYSMLRRASTGKDEDTPVLLVANTFRTKHAMSERDSVVPPEVIRRAAEDRVLVVRTIDLVRLGQRAANGFPAAAQLRDALASGGGWFEVDPSLTATTRAA
jgi:hypothetical protein